MNLGNDVIEEIKRAAGSIGEYGKITILPSGGGRMVDIITEDRKRVKNDHENEKNHAKALTGNEKQDTL